jgi:hypothetical protein
LISSDVRQLFCEVGHFGSICAGGHRTLVESGRRTASAFFDAQRLHDRDSRGVRDAGRGGPADRFGSKGDIGRRWDYVCFAPKTDIRGAGGDVR